MTWVVQLWSPQTSDILFEWRKDTELEAKDIVNRVIKRLTKLGYKVESENDTSVLLSKDDVFLEILTFESL